LNFIIAHALIVPPATTVIRSTPLAVISSTPLAVILSTPLTVILPVPPAVIGVVIRKEAIPIEYPAIVQSY